MTEIIQFENLHDEVNREKIILFVVDKLIVILPSYEEFQLHLQLAKIPNYKKVLPIIDQIDLRLRHLKYINVSPRSSLRRLTELGREVKETGGHFAYLELVKKEKVEIESSRMLSNRLNNNTYYYNIASTVIALIAVITSIYFGIQSSNHENVIEDLNEKLLKSNENLYNAREEKTKAVFELRKIHNEYRIKEIKEQMSSNK